MISSKAKEDFEMVRKKTEFLGVKVILIPNWRARRAEVAICSNSSVWLRLADGTVATNNAGFFRWAHIHQSKSDATTAEMFWRLGVIPKAEYHKIRDQVKAYETRQTKQRAANEIRHAAKKVGLTLTPVQLKTLAEAS